MGGQGILRPRADKLRGGGKQTGQSKSKQEKLQTGISGAKLQVSSRTSQAGGKEWGREEQPPPASFQQGQSPREQEGGSGGASVLWGAAGAPKRGFP